jgi:hypothetical protein
MRPRPQPRDLSWTTIWQAIGRIATGATAPVALKVALVVGTILSAANQGIALVDGTATWVTWIRVFVNYLVPYIVSSIGYLAPFKIRPATDAGASASSTETER